LLKRVEFGKRHCNYGENNRRNWGIFNSQLGKISTGIGKNFPNNLINKIKVKFL
jgi:hypothetical protein